MTSFLLQQHNGSQLEMCFSQASLKKLMRTVEKAEPFFVFCIRSNRQKVKSYQDSMTDMYKLYPPPPPLRPQLLEK